MRSFTQKQHQVYEWESLNVTPHPKRTGPLRQAHPILDLQRTHGNRVMQRLLHANAQTLYRQPLPKDHKDRRAILAHTLKDLLEAYPAGTVQITGHTDATGDDDLNERLGQQRADAVSDFLVEKGVPAAALASLTAGERQLRIKTNRPEPRNRR